MRFVCNGRPDPFCLVYIDPDGRIPVLLIGALVGGAFDAYSAIKDNKDPKYVVLAFAAGGLKGIIPGGFAVQFLANVGINMFVEGVEQLGGSPCGINAGAIVWAGMVGAAGSVAGGVSNLAQGTLRALTKPVQHEVAEGIDALVEGVVGGAADMSVGAVSGAYADSYGGTNAGAASCGGDAGGAKPTSSSAGTSGPSGYVEIQASLDPNQLIGPRGFGAANFLDPQQTFTYRIDFENDPDATAPAQQVEVTNQLPMELDSDSFELTGIGFGDTVVPVPEGSGYFETRMPVSYGGVDFEVEVRAGIDPLSGEVFARFFSLDSQTGLSPTVDIGFLPPEDGTGRGQGYLTYVVKPRPGLADNTEIRNVARIQFDRGEMIDTNQVDPHDPSQGTDPSKEALVTVDATAPISSVVGLPSTSPRVFELSLSGSDAASGVAYTETYVRDDLQTDWRLWASTSDGDIQFVGEPGRSYEFYSLAVDNVGRRESKIPTVEASTYTTGQTILDIDSNGHIDALTDGILVMRYVSGRRGDSLTQGAVAPNAARDEASIEAHLGSVMDILDVDDNGQTDPESDGKLILRYLFGFRGEVLIDGVIANGANRQSADAVEDYMRALAP